MSDTPSGPPQRMTDFFALEAGEYLERLDGALQSAGGTPPIDELVRLSRALRGSALMANKSAIARSAAGVESVVRAVKEGRLAWDAGLQQTVIRAVDDLKILIRQAAAWTDADTVKAETLSAELEKLAGRRVSHSAPRSADAPTLDAGARAFVAREGAAIAGALDRASQALRANPLAHDPLAQVIRALQPLRGLAALNDLPPLPDLLEGIERAIGEMERADSSTAPTGVGELFQAAASAIASAAREVAERGRPDPEGAEFKTYAGLLVRFFDGAETEPGVVSIASLYYGDRGPHIVKRGTPAARPATLGRLELVSHGEHLRQAADSLERAPSATQRELRAHTLAGTFRALMNVGGGPLAAGVAEFASAGREAVLSGIAVQHAADFAAELRRAGDVLTRSSTDEERMLAGELEAVTAAVRTLGEPVVPIESLAPEPAPPEPPAAAPAQVPAPVVAMSEDAIPETPDLIGSWVTFDRLAAAGVGAASLEVLLAGGEASAPAPIRVAPTPPRIPIPAPSPAPPTRAPEIVPPAVEPAVADIRTLLYRGESARRRAQELRATARTASGDALRALVDEVCDLVGLALDA